MVQMFQCYLNTGHLNIYLDKSGKLQVNLNCLILIFHMCIWKNAISLLVVPSLDDFLSQSELTTSALLSWLHNGVLKYGLVRYSDPHYNGILGHSLATLEGAQEFVFFIEPSFAFSAPLSLSLLLIALSFLFPLGGCMHAYRHEGLPEGQK